MISIIVAVADNGVIGKKGVMLPWRLPADLAHFKQVTTGHPVIMGQTTYQTIGRPLPGRQNIVLTLDKSFTAPGCDIVYSLQDALAKAKGDPFIIGGGSVYQQALPLAQKLYITKVHAKPDGDVFFTFNPQEWRLISEEQHGADAHNQYDYTFTVYERVVPRR